MIEKETMTKFRISEFADKPTNYLLIAESNPKEKDVIIDLVINFLNNN